MRRPITEDADPVGGSLAQRAAALGVVTGRLAEDGLIVEDGAIPTLLHPTGSGPCVVPSLVAIIGDLMGELRPRPARPNDPAEGTACDPATGVTVFGLGRTWRGETGYLRFAAVIDTEVASDAIRRDLAAAGITVPEVSIDSRHLDGVHELLLGMATSLEAERMTRVAATGLREQLASAFEQLSTLYQIGRTLNELSDPVRFVEGTTRQLARVFDFAWTGIQYVEAGIGGEALEDVLLVQGELPLDRAAFGGEMRSVIQSIDTPGDASIRRRGEDTSADLFGTDFILDPIEHDGRVVGAVFAGGRRTADPDVTTFETQLLDAVSDFLGVFHSNLTRYAAQASLLNGTVRALSSAIDAKDPYTRGHSERVGFLTARIAEELGWPAAQVERAHLSGILHDVGKIGVREDVLSKAGKLTDDEYDEIKRHPVIGYDILRDIPPMADILPGVLHHHERIDGRGYPDGLNGSSIPLLARVIAVADGFDAMSSDRAYRVKMPRSKVLDILRECAGSQWDAEVVAAFLRIDLAEYDAMIESHQAEGRRAA